MEKNCYIIRDKHDDCWLKIQRIVNDNEIVTIVDNVNSYLAATAFKSIEFAQTIIKEIENEGNYDIEGFEICSLSEIKAKDEAEKEKQKQEKLKAIAESQTSTDE